MFNQAAFNALPFNREYNVNVALDFALDHSNEMAWIGNVEIVPQFEIDHSLDDAFTAFRDRVSAFAMDLLQEMDFSAVRHRTARFDMAMTLASDFNLARSQVLTLTLSGPFAPGDKIIIDSEKLKITKNGVNALQDMQGDFISLFVGENRLSWTDDQTQRDVLIRLQYRDIYL